MSSPILLELRGAYAWKPAFQRWLWPVVKLMARMGVRANQVTCATVTLSAITGFILLRTDNLHWFLMMPAVLFARMALNAADGMLARQFGQQSRLGVYLNELGDVFSDLCLYWPFLHLPGFDASWMGGVVSLAVIAELAGALGPMVGSSRCYEGPMGKSDRAVFFGGLGLWIGLANRVPAQVGIIVPRVLALLLLLTVFNRVRAGLNAGLKEGEAEHATLR